MNGFVYFIAPEAVFFREEEDLQVVKIGFTRFNPVARMRDLQVGSPVSLQLVAYIDGCLKLEKAFHDCFAELRWQGEWFLLDRKLHDFLGYFVNLPRDEKYVDRARLGVSVYDNIFAKASSYPHWSDEEYLASAEPRYLEAWFPEACEA